MKNQEITEFEIIRITYESPKREKAIFTIMRQSGLKLSVIKKLKIGDVEGILDVHGNLDPNPPLPSKITVPNEKTPRFIAYESIYYLTEYLKERRKSKQLSKEQLLFCARKKPTKEIDTKNTLRTFRETHPKNGAPLSSLTRFYQDRAKEYETQLKNNPPKDDEACRKLYIDYAMNPLDIEPSTSKRIIHQQQNETRKKAMQITQLQEQVDCLEKKIPNITNIEQALRTAIEKITGKSATEYRIEWDSQKADKTE